MKDNEFFKNKNGKILFYPWAYPGEYFEISKTQEIVLSLYILCIVALICILAFKPSIFNSLSNLSSINKDLMGYIGLSLAPILYILGIFIFSKYNKLHEEKGNKEKKIHVIIWLILMSPIFIILKILIYNLFSFNYLLLGFINLIIVAFLVLFINKTKKTKGYVFNK